MFPGEMRNMPACMHECLYACLHVCVYAYKYFNLGICMCDSMSVSMCGRTTLLIYYKLKTLLILQGSHVHS